MTHLLLAVIYISFISLGLPDALLGAAWPIIYPEFGVPVSWAGVISTIISVGTVVSSLMSSRITRRLGTGKVTALSVAVTAAALLGFSASSSFWMMCLWAVPYGLGAGSMDASLNNYVTLHYASRHISWLHCMWGLGASVGPYIMGAVLTRGQGWSMGYRLIGLLQIGLTAVLVFTLPLWKRTAARAGNEEVTADGSALRLPQIEAIPGVKANMVAFFCYCGLEQTAGLWASSYLVLHRGVDSETAASFASLFFVGVALGRGLSGFLTLKLNDTQMVRLGQGIIAVGVAAMVLPLGEGGALAGLMLIGLGCAPVYPCLIHATPARFGAERSQSIIGVEMASAYVGTSLMPPLFGLAAEYISVALLPVFLLAILLGMVLAHEGLVRRDS